MHLSLAHIHTKKNKNIHIPTSPLIPPPLFFLYFSFLRVQDSISNPTESYPPNSQRAGRHCTVSVRHR